LENNRKVREKDIRKEQKGSFLYSFVKIVSSFHDKVCRNPTLREWEDETHTLENGDLEVLQDS
jgi:asparagine synthetase A